MSKNKVIIVVSIIIVVVILGIAIYFGMQSSQSNQNDNQSGSKRLSKIYQEMAQNETYNVSLAIDNDNKTVIIRKGDKARIEKYSDGEVQTQIIRDGNTYLLRDDDKKYFKYQNNQTELTALLKDIDNTIQSQEPKEGKEEIDGKRYNYEEYTGIDYFLIENTNNANQNNLSTRFYFDGNDLKYIRTKSDSVNELLEVDISYDVNDNEFELPSDYTEG